MNSRNHIAVIGLIAVVLAFQLPTLAMEVNPSGTAVPNKIIATSTTGGFPSSLEWGSDKTLDFVSSKGKSWQFIRDGSTLEEGQVTDQQISIEIHWREDNWQLKDYNLSLLIMTTEGSESTSAVVSVLPYSNSSYGVEILDSSWTIYPDLALGSPDGDYSQTSYDYENGRISLLMGRVIVDGDGNDFNIYAKGGNYTLVVKESEDGIIKILGSFQGNQSIDLATYGISEAGVVRIQYLTGDDIFLDSVEGLNTKIRTSEPPSLEDLPDRVFDAGKAVTLTWKASDPYAVNYTIYINGDVAESSFWYGGDITYTFTPTAQVELYITVRNIKGETADDKVLFQDNRTTDSTTSGMNFLTFGGLSLLSMMILASKRRFQN